jgi:iron complex outermembrane recepter protein
MAMNGSHQGRVRCVLRVRAIAALVCLGAMAANRSAHAESDELSTALGGLKNLSIEQLMDVEVTSVSKTAQPVGDAPAAIYVITHDDIVRSGAISVPEVLRLAPNLQVVQISASNYTITARGFSGNSAAQNFSDKLLVLIDGRTVYSPLYSGVYWDAQDVVLDDVDRIEIISGAGSTLWGANAVNGVINIITRTSSETQGAAVGVGAGSLEKNANAQFGGRLSEDASYRVYAKGFERSALDLPSGQDGDDSWSKIQAGFRSDWNRISDSVTVQGDVYRGNERALGAVDTSLTGANLLARWRHTLSDASTLQVQSYYDQTQRFTIGAGAFVLNTYDVELQDSLSLGSRNEIVWGGGYRSSRYAITSTPTFLFLPDNATLNLGDAFAQDTISLAPGLNVIAGIKFENDPYSGTTPLPNARISWKVNESSLLWSAVSRAIRSATPFDRNVAEYLGGTLLLIGGPNFQPEKLIAYESGYRGQIGPSLSFSASAFYNVYDDLRSIEVAPDGLFLPLRWGNAMHGDTYGAEFWGNYQVREWWRVDFGFNELRENFRFKLGSSGLLGVAQAGDDPSHQASLRSSMILRAFTLDANLRYVASLPNPEVAAYTELNARLGWHISQHWEAALSGSNLLHAHHEEFTAPPSEAISRAVFVDARLKF